MVHVSGVSVTRDDFSGVSVQADCVTGVVSFGVFGGRQKSKKALGLLDKLKLGLSCRVSRSVQLYFVSNIDMFEQVMVRLGLEGLDLEMSQKSLKASLTLKLQIKAFGQSVFESIVEKLAMNCQVKLSQSDSENKAECSVQVDSMLLNCKPSFAKSLTYVQATVKGQSRPSTVTHLQIVSQLEHHFELNCHNKHFVVKESFCTLDISSQAANEVPRVFFWSKEGDSRDMIGVFVGRLTAMEDEAMEREENRSGGKAKDSADAVDKCRLRLDGKWLEFEIGRNEVRCFEFGESVFYRVMVQTSIAELTNCVSVRTNVRIANTTGFKFIVKYFRVCEEREENQLGTTSLGGAQGVQGYTVRDEESEGKQGSVEHVRCLKETLLRTEKVKPGEDIFLPFFPDFRQVFYSLSLSRQDHLAEHKQSFEALFVQKSQSTTCFTKDKHKQCHFVVVVNERPVETVPSRAQHTPECPHQSDVLLTIECGLKVINRLPIKFRLFFAEKKRPWESKSQIDLKQSMNSLSSMSMSSIEINCSEFSEEQIHKFRADHFNRMFINSFMHSDSIKLCSDPGARDIDTAHNESVTKPTMSEEVMIVHMQNHFDVLTNAVLSIRRLNTRFELCFSSELIFVSELNFRLELGVTEGSFKYSRIDLGGHGVLFKNEAENDNLANSYFSLEDLTSKKTFWRLTRKKHRAMSCFTGNLAILNKKLAVSSEGHSTEFGLAKLKDRESLVVSLGSRTVVVSLLSLEQSVSRGGFVFFHYPFYLTNNCSENLLILVHQLSDKLLILERNKLFNSEDLVGPNQTLCNCKFVLKSNKNDFEWSDKFVLFTSLKSLSVGTYFLKSRNVKRDKPMNFQLAVTAFQLSKLITITQWEGPNFRVFNNLKVAVLASQFEGKEADYEVALPGSVVEFCYVNSFASKELILFTNLGNKYTLLCRLNFGERLKPVLVDKRGMEAFEVIPEREGQLCLVRIQPVFQDEKRAMHLSVGPRIRSMMNTLRNQSVFPLSLDLFAKKKSDNEQVVYVTLRASEVLLSVCDDASREMLLVRLGQLRAEAGLRKTPKKERRTLSLQCDEFQLDSQLDYNNHNVG